MRIMFVLLLAGLLNFPVLGASKGKILVVFSSEDKITVEQKKFGKTHEHPTGFFLTELMIPLKALKKEGFRSVSRDLFLERAGRVEIEIVMLALSEAVIQERIMVIGDASGVAHLPGSARQRRRPARRGAPARPRARRWGWQAGG